MNDKNELAMKRLSKTLAGMDPARLRHVLAKDAAITIRLSASDKEDMRRTAAACNLTITEYLTRLHCIAAGVLEKQKK